MNEEQKVAALLGEDDGEGDVEETGSQGKTQQGEKEDKGSSEEQLLKMLQV